MTPTKTVWVTTLPLSLEAGSRAPAEKALASAIAAVESLGFTILSSIDLRPSQEPTETRKRLAGAQNPSFGRQSPHDTHTWVAPEGTPYDLKAEIKQYAEGIPSGTDMQVAAAAFADTIPKEVLREAAVVMARAALPAAHATIRSQARRVGARRPNAALTVSRLMMPDPFYVGRMVSIRDFTPERLIAYGERMKSNGAANIVVGERYIKLAQEVQARGRATVRGLDDRLVLDILGDIVTVKLGT